MSEAGMMSYGHSTTNEDRSMYHEKSTQKRWRCVWITVGCSCILSLLCGVFVVFLIIQVSTLKRTLLIETESSQNMSSHRSDIPHYEFLKDENVKVFGMFKIDQNIVKENESVRWMADTNSQVEPLPDSACLRIPIGGNYLISSRFTFTVPSDEKKTLITHYFKVINEKGEMKENSFRRKYVSLLENTLRTGGEDMRKVSLLLEIYDINSNEQICANTSSPDLLYASSLDNDINILKV